MSDIEVRVTREVDVRQAYGEAMLRCLTRAMLAVHEDATVHAPVDTGLLRASLAPGAGVTRVDTAFPPTFAQVGPTTAVYPAVLDESDRTHYARGQFAGAPTKGWLSDSLGRTEGRLREAFDTFARELQAAVR